ncbi:MAG: DUF3800 domain-containing protein [Desulfobaccales bacterium]
MKSVNNFGGFLSIEEYLHYLWWNMHHSDDSDRQTFAVTCYLDESGTDDQNPQAVIGGLLMNRYNFISFGRFWSDILSYYKIEAPLHMKEFGRPHGRLAHITNEVRWLLFNEISVLIKSHKIYSLAATINQEQFKKYYSEIENISVYGMCFLLSVFINHQQAGYKNYTKQIAYILDQGNKYRKHVDGAHIEIIKWQKEKSWNVGSLTFSDDINVSALQAADIISWGTRRRISGLKLVDGFEPIDNILDDKAHIQARWEENWLQELASILMEKLQVI